jgi:hypothetical protein
LGDGNITLFCLSHIYIYNGIFHTKVITWDGVMSRGSARKYKDVLAKVCLILGTFFNPLGFDAAFALVTKLTKSYIVTDIIFYSVALLFFGLYFLLSRK